MGTWTDPITSDDIAEDDGGGSAGDGVGSPVQYPEPGEGYHFEVIRTDSADDSDPWRVALEGTLDGVDFGQSPPLDEHRLPSGQDRVEIPVRGPIYGCRIWVENDDATPSDVVAATVRFRRDAVSI
jgi:hypothetical protein